MASFLDAYAAPKKDIPRRAYLTVSTLVVAAILAVWCALSYGGLVRGDFLPTPDEVVTAAINGIDDGSLLVNTGVSVTEIMSGFIIASIFAVPLGILMGSFKIVEAALEPVTNFVRYLPVSALIPLLILWVGIDIEEKITVIFIGTFFQQLILIADVSRGVSQDLLDVSYTLGANRRTVVARVLIPATLPGVMDTLRVTLGWAWTYLVVAELVAANKGLGYFILNSMRGLFTDQIFLGIMVIGLLGLITDQLFKLLRNRLLPWAAGVTVAASPKLRIDNVALRFTSRRGVPVTALENISLDVEDKEFSVIVGPSGCGKTSLLRLVAGLIEPTEGAISLDDTRISGPGRDRGMVFQSYTLFPVAHGAGQRGIRAADRRHSRGTAARDGATVHRPGRLERVRAAVSEAALRRDDAARGAGARARQRSGDPADGRAVRRARQPDAIADAGVAARHLAGLAQDRAVHHPRHRRIDPARRPGLCDDGAAWPHQGDGADRAAAATHRRDADQRRVHGHQAAHHASDPRRGDAKRRDGATSNQELILRRPPSTAGHSRAARTDRGQTPADRLSAYGQFFADQRRHVGVCSKSRQCHTRRRLFAACRHVTRRAPFVGSIPIRSCRFGRRRQLGQPVDDPPARLAVHESAACRASGAANAQIVGHYRFPLSELCGYRRCDLCRCLLRDPVTQSLSVHGTSFRYGAS